MLRSLDHLVLTVLSIDRAAHFYQNVLGCERRNFGEGRVALHFGTQKINLHEVAREFEPKAAKPTSGSADLCFIVEDIEAAGTRLSEHKIEVIEGPVERTGAQGRITSIYLRDPDGNLLELAQYD